MLHLQTFRGKILVYRDGGGLPVAEMDEQEACRRILHAPDLLAACEAAFAVLDLICREDSWEQADEALVAVRTAIAKARGQ